MRNSPRPTGTLAWLALAVAPATLFAQTASPPPSDNEQTVILSPFEVRTDRDVGFVASSSLAGGRLATDLRDTPAAYSVITREFIEALAITDLAEAATWSPNTVTFVASNGGGYGDDVSNNPGAYDVRGAAGSARPQRNFFIYNAPMDSYAIERYDFGRGPNAILFGNGSLGGVSSSMTKQARFGRSFTEVTQGVGSWNRFRTTLDVNRSLSDRFAVRAAALWFDRDGWRERQFENGKALFLTGTYKLSENTSVRLEGEVGEGERNQTFHNLTDQFSGWDGKSTFSGRLTTLPANADSLGINRYGNAQLVYNPQSGVDAVMNYAQQAITVPGGVNNRVPIAGYVQGSLPGFNTGNATLLSAQNVPPGRFDNAIAGSNFRVPSRSFSTSFDYPAFRTRYNDLQLTVDHRIGDVFIQFAVDSNRSHQSINTTDVRQGGYARIDINETLPDGTPNPKVRHVYSDSLYRKTEDNRDANGARVAIGTVKDLGKWGNYTVNVMGGYTETTDEKEGAYVLSIGQDPDHRRWGAAGGQLPRTQLIWTRIYWDEPSRPYNPPTSVRLFDPVTGVDQTITPFWALENTRSDSFQISKAKFTYGIAALSAKLFEDRLILLGAVRADDFYSLTRQQIHAGDYSPTDWDGVTGQYRPAAPADYYALDYEVKNADGTGTGVVREAITRPRDANGNRLPQYANDRFKDDYDAPAVEELQWTKSVGAVFHLKPWLSPYVNYAETFNPPVAIQRIDSTFLDPTVAKGTDFGLRFSLLGGRLMMNALYYQNSEINNPMDHGIQSPLNALLGANVVGDFTPGGRNKRNLADVPNVMRDIRDRSADGFEFEITANLTRSWRLLFNVGLPRVYEENSFQDIKRYLEENGDTLQQIVLDAGGVFDSAGVASVDQSIPADQRSPDVSSAVNNYNSIMRSRANMIDGKRKVQDQPNFNLFTDYTFREGPLRGFGVGVGWQYREPTQIGFRAGDRIVDPNDPTKAIDDPTVDAYSPAFAPDSYSEVIGTLRYLWKLENNREIEFRLRVNNLLNEDGVVWTNGSTLRPTNGDYTSPARETVATNFAFRTPRNYYLTATFRF